MKRLEWVLLPLAGALLFYVFSPAREITYTEVIVPAARIQEREPPVDPGIRERIVYRYVPVAQRAVAPGGALEQAEAFCRPVALATTDTVTVVDTLLLVRSFTHDPGWFWQKDNLLVTGLTNVGDLEASDYRVRPGFSAVAVGDSVLVRYPRLALPRELLELGVILSIGFGIGQAF